MRARTSNELKISIESAPLACPETKDETHFLPLPLFVPIAEFDPADQRVRSGMSVRTEMLCDGKTRRILVDASEVFTKTFPQSAPSLADVNRDLKHQDGRWRRGRHIRVKAEARPASRFTRLS